MKTEVAFIRDRSIRLDEGLSVSGQPAAVRYSLPQSRTTLVERFLLFVAMMILPLENYFPTVAGMTVNFLMFALLAAYIIANRTRVLGKTWYHPVFLAAYAFIVVSAPSGIFEPAFPLRRHFPFCANDRGCGVRGGPM